LETISPLRWESFASVVPKRAILVRKRVGFAFMAVQKH
jgi:hypothetical protein